MAGLKSRPIKTGTYAEIPKVDESLIARLRVIRVMPACSVQIVEAGNGFVEADAMLADVGCGLLRVELESEGSKLTSLCFTSDCIDLSRSMSDAANRME
jgi:hypothetical protein